MLPLFRRRVCKKSRYDSTLPQKSQQKIQDTLPQKSQHKIKIGYHSSAEESAKNQDTLPLFRRRVSKVKIRFHSSAEESVFQAGGWRIFPPKIYILWGWRILPQSNFTLVGLTHIPPHQIFMGLTQFPQSLVIMWSKVFPMLGCAWWCIVPRDSQNLCMCFLLFLLFNG